MWNYQSPPRQARPVEEWEGSRAERKGKVSQGAIFFSEVPFGSRASERSWPSLIDAFWQGDIIPPENRRQPRDICGIGGCPIGAQLFDCGLHVDGIPVSDNVECDPQRTELFFLPLSPCVAHWTCR